MNMVEKVARAIWDYNECSEAGLQWDCEHGTMSDLQKHMSIDCARKCIEAMYEPTEEMKKYATKKMIGYGDDAPEDIYKFMIEAAL